MEFSHSELIKFALVIVVCATGCEPATSRYTYLANNYLPPTTGYDNVYLPPSRPVDHHEHHQQHESEVPKSYEFGYSVSDSRSGVAYNRHEASDGTAVRGEYRVLLPDGRTQIVTYHADWLTGYHAEVRYEGGPNNDYTSESTLPSYHGNRSKQPRYYY